MPTFCQSTSAPREQLEKEQQLRTALEEMQGAIDHYRGMADRGKIMTLVESRNYPVDLETLVKGDEDSHGKTIQFLGKIPIDPMTGTTDWGLKRAGPQGGGIFDVYAKSGATALDGTKY